MEHDQVTESTIDIKISVGAATSVGGRTENEDAILVRPLDPVGVGPGSQQAGYLLAVADGMGGHEGGEIASRLAVETLDSAFKDAAEPDVAATMKSAFRRANARIFSEGSGAGDATSMGTTMVACAVRGKYATIASVGDSRAYLVRASRLTQITQDHTLVAQQLAQGELTADQAKRSPARNQLMHALGHRERLHSSMPSIFEVTLLPEDRLFLCSDGFYDVVEDGDIVDTVGRLGPDDAAKALTTLATERKTTDNVSAIVLEAESTRIVVAPVAAPTAADGRSILLPILAAIVVLAVVAVVLYLMVL
jgi:protein phosphatase